MDEQLEEELIRHFNRWRGAIVGRFVKKGFSQQDAEDLTQKTFLNAFRSLDSFRRESELKTWIFTIADNLALKSYRDGNAAKRRGDEVALEDAPEAALDSALSSSSQAGREAGWREGEQLQMLLTRERVLQVRQAMATLPWEIRSCIVLFVVQQRKYHEIAELLDIPINTVKTRIHEGRKRLRKRLGPEWGDLGL